MPTSSLAAVPFFQVDAFAHARFAGNPAAVMVLEGFLGDDHLQEVAAENNLAETAFIVRGDGGYDIRWFTPSVEVPLCGHATLASAAVVMERLEPGIDAVRFFSASGPLSVARRDGAYVMNFPACRSRVVDVPAGLTEALGARPTEVAHDGFNFIARLESEATVISLVPRMDLLKELPVDGVVVTTQGSGSVDIMSRYFAPAKGIPEDAVTGGAHCALAPFWAERLGRSSLRAQQVSPRGGFLTCRLEGDRVELSGTAVFYLEGVANVTR